MLDPQLLAFTLAALLVTVSPGPDTFLVIGNTSSGGRRAGLATVAGIVSGGAFHAALFGFGIARLLAWSPVVFSTVKLCGAAYLVYLGVRALRAAFGAREPAKAPEARNRRELAAWSQGMLSNALNPKVAVFYLAFLPQFMSPDDPIAARSMLLIGIHCLLGAAWLSLLVVTVASMSAWLARSRVQRALDALVGTVMVAFGAKLAFANGRLPG